MRARIFLLLLLLVIVLIGCQRSGRDADSLPTFPSIQASAGSFGDGGHQLLGIWEMTADAGAGTLEAAPMRGGAFHMNVRQWVEEPVMNLEILYARALPNNGLETRIQITHPFKNPVMWGFDVRGICILPGSREYPTIGAWVSDESKGDPVLANAQGYTRLWNPAQFQGSGIFAWTPGKLGKTPPVIGIATVNGFRNFMTDRSRHAYQPGVIASAYYYLRLPAATVKFTYAIDASWAPPTVTPPSGVDDFPVTANMPEAYRVAAALTPEYSETGSGILTVDIADWQGPDTVSTVRYELPSELGGSSGEMPMTHVRNNEARFRTTVNGSLGVGGERILVEVLDKVVDPHAGPCRSYAFAKVLPPGYLPWPQEGGPRFDGCRRSEALGPLEPTLVAELAWPGQSSYFPQALVHKGDYIVSSRDFADGKNHRYLAIYKADGSLVWGEETDDSYLYSPSQIILNGSNNVFIGHFQPASGDSFLECRDLGGNVKWSKSWPIESDPDAESHIFGIARDGSFYTINWIYLGGFLYDRLLSITKFSSSGDMSWKYVPESAWNEFPSPDEPVQLASGELVFDTTESSETKNRILALDDTDGAEAWSSQYDTGLPDLGGNWAQTAVGPDGLVYCQLALWYPVGLRFLITRVTTSGEMLNQLTDFNGVAFGPIAIGPDGTIYYMHNWGPSSYSLRAIDPDGEGGWGTVASGSFCLDAAGCAYTDGGLSIDPDGQLRYDAGAIGGTEPIMDSRGRIIAPRGFVYADTAD